MGKVRCVARTLFVFELRLRSDLFFVSPVRGMVRVRVRIRVSAGARARARARFMIVRVGAVQNLTLALLRGHCTARVARPCVSLQG